MQIKTLDYVPMIKKPPIPQSRPLREQPQLYVGQWIRALGAKPAEVARATNINEGYLSQIISGAKTNPSRAFLKQIADYLGITVGDFDGPPPAPELLDEIAKIDPKVLDRLRKNRE